MPVVQGQESEGEVSKEPDQRTAAYEMGYATGANDARETIALLFDDEADVLGAFLATLPRESKIALHQIATLRAYALRIRAVEIESEETASNAEACEEICHE